MDLKSLEDWTVEKAFKSVPNVVDVASFGGPTREYQVRIDPSKLISYRLSIGQLEQQIAAVQTAVGGNALTQVLQEDRRYDLVLRTFRNTAIPRRRSRTSAC
jgi:cobalt-zinc-cadmium resistance protein CzcA